jgi:hypothetical protein
VLDFDGTDLPVHGDQPGKFFNAYYDHHCYFPLYVFCGRHLLVSYLRTSNRSDSHHSWAILALLVRFIRQYWPDTRIVFRGDSGFYRPRLLSWCDRNNVDYLVGISKNSRLPKEVDVPSMLVRKAHHELSEKVSATYRFQYQATPGHTPVGWWHAGRKGSWGPIQGSSSAPATTTALSSTMSNTAPEAIWKTGSKISSYACSQTVPPARSGGPISGGCSCRALPTRCSSDYEPT